MIFVEKPAQREPSRVAAPADAALLGQTASARSRRESRTICDGTWEDLIPAALLGTLACLSIAYLTLFPNTAPDDGLRAVVFPPWMTEAEMLSRIVEANALPVRGSALGFVVFAKPVGAAFAQRVGELGAWIVANPVGYTACGSSSS